MIELILDSVLVILSMISVYFLMAGSRHEDDSVKSLVRYLCLALFFFILYNLTYVFSHFNIGSVLLSVDSRLILGILVSVCMVAGMGTIKKSVKSNLRT